MLEPSSTSAGTTAVHADVVVGVPADPDRVGAAGAALALESGLREVFPGRNPVALVLTDDPGAAAPGDLTAPRAGAPLAVYTGEHAGPAAALPTLLEAALARDAPACALFEPFPRGPGNEWLRLVLEPILERGYDLICPTYTRGKLEGVLVSGIVYPLTRALFGVRIRQPLGREIALSRRLAEQLLRDEAWRSDPAHAGADLWVITRAASRDCRIAQACLGPRPRPVEPAPDVADALARVLGLLFHEMELQAHRWQRVRRSMPCETFGEMPPTEGAHPHHGVPALVSGFALGWQDLRSIWAAVLPPQTMLAVQRLARLPPEEFRFPDAVWARIIYDFAVGWRVKAFDRTQLLRSMAPLYRGWVASWFNEVMPLDPSAAEARLEQLCTAFESEKPYLISRWRWPDRFRP